ncbi:MAG: right-handed parallel beta-helix repeat-containing protein [Bacteroidia bacterium]
MQFLRRIASATAIDPVSVCPGLSNVLVEVTNRGSKRLSTVTVDATVNGVPTSLSGRKFTFNPPLSRNASAVVNVGTAAFVSGTNYTINAATRLPNSRPDLLPANDATSLTKQPGLSGTFSVGAGGDFATIAAAISELNSVGVCGPTVFAIAPGTYTNSEFTLNEIPGASSVNTVTFQPASKKWLIQNDPTSTTDNFVFRFTNSGWVNLKNLKLTNTDPSSYGTLILLTGLNTGITVEGCALTVNSTLNTTGTNLAAVYCSTSASDILKGFTFRNNSITNAAYGLYLYGNSSSTAAEDSEDLLIEGNTITGVKYMGMYIGYNRTFKINNNIVEKVPYTTSYGIYCFYSTAKAASQIEVTGNKVVEYGTTTMYGIYFSGFYNTAPALIANNMVSLLDNPSSSTSYGMYVSSCQNMNIYHNSVYINSGSATSGIGLYLVGTTSSGLRIINNNVVNTGGGYAVYVSSSTPIQSMNFNNWYATGSNLGYYYGGVYSDLAAWRSASGFDGLSVSVDPKFNDEDDLHANSIGIDARGLAGVMAYDIDGDARCPGAGCPGASFAPDLGADEYEVPPIDLTPGKVVSPSEDGFGCNQGTAIPVVIEILNNGSQPLNFAVNPATVSWTAGGQSGSITINTGGILVGGSMNVTVGTIDLSIAGVYSYDLTATVVGDLKTSNDQILSASTVISRNPINTFPYVETFDGFPTCTESSTTPCPLPSASGWTNGDQATAWTGLWTVVVQHPPAQDLLMTSPEEAITSTPTIWPTQARC